MQDRLTDEREGNGNSADKPRDAVAREASAIQKAVEHQLRRILGSKIDQRDEDGEEAHDMQE